MLCRCKNDCRPQLCCYRPIAVLRLFCYVFALEFLFNPHFDLEPDYIIRKPIIHRILWYIPRREMLSTFHTWVDNRSIRHFCIAFTPKLPLPLRRSPPKSNTPIPSPTPLTTQRASRSIQSFCHNTHVRTDRWGWRMFYPNSALLYERRANNNQDIAFVVQTTTTYVSPAVILTHLRASSTVSAWPISVRCHKALFTERIMSVCGTHCQYSIGCYRFIGGMSP